MQKNPRLEIKGALSVPEFCSWASIGRTLVYKLIKERQLKPFKVGRRTLIPLSEAQRWLEAQSTCVSEIQ